jgi:hypothetical protein
LLDPDFSNRIGEQEEAVLSTEDTAAQLDDINRQLRELGVE